MVLGGTSSLEISTEPNRRVGTVSELTHGLVSRDEGLSDVNRVELICVVPRETLLLERLRHIYPCGFGASETRLGGMKRGEDLANVSPGPNHHGSRTKRHIIDQRTSCCFRIVDQTLVVRWHGGTEVGGCGIHLHKNAPTRNGNPCAQIYISQQTITRFHLSNI